MSPKSTQLSTVALSESEQRQMGEQLTAQYRKAQSAQLEIITFGAMLIDAEGFIATCGEKPSSKGGRPNGGLSAWLKQFAPDIAYTTARRYRDIAEALVGHLHLKSTEQLKLLTSTDTLDAKLAKKRAQLLDLVTERSVRGIQLELGLRDEVTTRGGHHPKKAEAPAEPSKPAAAPDWCSEAEKALWRTLTSDEQRNAFTFYRPMLNELGHDMADQQRSLLPHLDDRTRADAVSTAEQLLSLLSPGLLRSRA